MAIVRCPSLAGFHSRALRAFTMPLLSLDYYDPTLRTRSIFERVRRNRRLYNGTPCLAAGIDEFSIGCMNPWLAISEKIHPCGGMRVPLVPLTWAQVARITRVLPSSAITL